MSPGRIWVTAILLLALAACGQKGALYLPDNATADTARSGDEQGKPQAGTTPSSTGTATGTYTPP